MYKIPTKKIWFVILIIFEMIIALFIINTCGRENVYKCFGVIISITVIFDCILMTNMNIRLYSPAAIFIILSYLFSFGQFIIEAYFPFHVYRYEKIILFYSDDIKRCAFFSFVIIQLVFLGIIVQRKLNNKDCTELNEDAQINYKYIRTLGYIISLICFPIWLYYNIQTYSLTKIKGGYVVGATQVNGIIVQFSYYIIIGMALLIIGYSNNKYLQRIIFVIEMLLLLVSMITGNRLFAVGSVCVLFYCYKMLTNKQLFRQVILIFIIIYFVAGIVASISHLRLNSVLTVTDIVNDSLSYGKESFLYVLEEFGGTIKSPLKVMQQIPSIVPYSCGKTYLFSLITLIPNFNDQIRSIYEKSIYLFSLQGNAAMGGSYIGELYYNFGYFSYLIAFPIGVFIGALTDRADHLILSKNYLVFSYYIMIIFGLYMWVRGYFTELIRGPIWAALLIYSIDRILNLLKKGKKYE